MRKVLLVGFVGFVLASFSMPAFAESSSDDGSKSNSSKSQQGHQRPPRIDDDSNNQVKHNHIKDLFEDITGVIIPPVAIKPGNRPHTQVLQIQGIQTNPDASQDNSNSVIPDEVTDGLTGVSDPTTDYSVTKLGSNSSGKTRISPTKSKPVQIRSLVLTKQTPSDEFMTGALVLGGALSVAVLALLTATSIHHLRMRKKA
jgi:hypothetical protein